MNEPIKPDWYGRLERGPAMHAVPTADHLRAIKQQIHTGRRRRRVRWLRTVTIACGAVILFMLLSSYGYKQWRHHEIQQALVQGSSEFNALQSATPKRFLNGEKRIVRLEAVKDGVLVFVRNDLKEGNTDLDVEYMRRTWKGWEYIFGGGFGGGIIEMERGLHYEYLPNADPYLHTYTPFPAVYGTVVGDKIASVVVTGDREFRATANLFRMEDGQRGWLVALPAWEDARFTITALDAEGNVVKEDTLDTREYNPKHVNE
ncbi:hypothetical protein [Cohnella nanjingensis]|uniref:Uncharacterized protein n=1 Tax=Cohnella nanjingensis TaxID=1387779 RepID=A0A7X0RWD7_9BACL|nr:hypothetical protein [Cohnella nanjingensis]MBB6674878.1 hypothetical protein [Cohnella nanjingensis]